MSVKLYMDVHVKRAVTDGLRLRGVDVLTAREDGAAEFEDDLLLDHATELNRVLFSQNDDLLREANKRQQTGETFKRCDLRASTQYHNRALHRRFGVDYKSYRTGRVVK